MQSTAKAFRQTYKIGRARGFLRHIPDFHMLEVGLYDLKLFRIKKLVKPTNRRIYSGAVTKTKNVAIAP